MLGRLNRERQGSQAEKSSRTTTGKRDDMRKEVEIKCGLSPIYFGSLEIKGKSGVDDNDILYGNADDDNLFGEAVDDVRLLNVANDIFWQRSA